MAVYATKPGAQCPGNRSPRTARQPDPPPAGLGIGRPGAAAAVAGLVGVGAVRVRAQSTRHHPPYDRCDHARQYRYRVLHGRRPARRVWGSSTAVRLELCRRARHGPCPVCAGWHGSGWLGARGSDIRRVLASIAGCRHPRCSGWQAHSVLAVRRGCSVGRQRGRRQRPLLSRGKWRRDCHSGPCRTLH